MTIDMGDLALLILFVLCLAIFVYLLIKVLKGRALRIDEVVTCCLSRGFGRRC